MSHEIRHGIYLGIQELSSSFKESLKPIIQKELTVENVETFADEALDDLMLLNDEILIQYKQNPNFRLEKSDLDLSNKELENNAYERLGLPNIQIILEEILRVKDKIDSIKDYLISSQTESDIVITEPNEDGPEVRPGSGSGLKDNIRPRLLTLMYILESDFLLDISNLRRVVGSVREDMFRKLPYIRIDISELNRVVYICEEEGNVTYVFDTNKLRELGIDYDTLDTDDKSTKNSIIESYPGVGIKIHQSKTWSKRMHLLLSEEIPQQLDNGMVVKENIDSETKRVSTSEFDPWKGFYTDENGDHWGTRGTIATRSGISSQVIYPECKNLTSIKIGDVFGRNQHGYKYEEVIKTEKMIRLMTTPKAETQGEWRGFYRDENGKLFGNLEVLGVKLGVSVTTILDLAIQNKVATKRIKIKAGRDITAYSFDELMPLAKELTSLPEINGVNEWTGFYEIDGLHFGSILKLSEKLNLSREVMFKIVKSLDNPRTKQYRDIGGVTRTGHSAEDVINSKLYNKFKSTESLPKVMPEVGNNAIGFYEENNLHWGSWNSIVIKLNITPGCTMRKTQSLYKTHKLPTKHGIDLSGKESDLVCLEEVEKLITPQN